MAAKSLENPRPARGRRIFLLVPACALLLAASCAGPTASEPAPAETSAEAPPAPGERVVAGEKFPPTHVLVLKPGAETVESLDLGADLGKRPVILVYFLLGHSVSEQVLGEVARFVDTEVPGKVALYPVVRLGLRNGLEELASRLELLGVERPVILDSDALIQKTAGAGVVPHITLIDSEGYVDFEGASSLKQPIFEEVDVREAIRIAARGEEPPTVFRLLKYFPVNDFIGEKFKDLELKDYASSRPLRFADHVGAGKVTAIFYWSPTCPYTRKAMPGIVAAHRQFAGSKLDLISVVRDGTPAEVGDFAEAHGIAFPILADASHAFTSLYRVVSTPTLIFIGPDGVIDSVYTSGNVNYYPIFATRIEKILGTGVAGP